MARRSEMGRPRSIRDTGFYVATVGLYAILVGVALIEPMLAMGDDILDHPLDGDWGRRALTVGLLVEAAVWFQALSAEMTLAQLAYEDVPRHPTLPGVTTFRYFWRSLVDFWFGTIMVLLLIVMAAAVARGPAAFLAVFTVYATADVMWDAVYLWRHWSHAVKAWPKDRRLGGLLQALLADRHLPRTDEDARILAAGSDRELDLVWARATWYWVALGTVFAIGAGALALLVSANPALATPVSVGWLGAIVVSTGIDYWLFPHYYAM